MLIEQVNPVGAQALQRHLGQRVDMFRAAAGAGPTRAVSMDVEAELAGDHQLVTGRGNRLAR